MPGALTDVMSLSIKEEVRGGYEVTLWTKLLPV